jgi:hypothetical protein
VLQPCDEGGVVAATKRDERGHPNQSVKGTRATAVTRSSHHD